jgi:hypothetical protein
MLGGLGAANFCAHYRVGMSHGLPVYTGRLSSKRVSVAMLNRLYIAIYQAIYYGDNFIGVFSSCGPRSRSPELGQPWFISHENTKLNRMAHFYLCIYPERLSSARRALDDADPDQGGYPFHLSKGLGSQWLIHFLRENLPLIRACSSSNWKGDIAGTWTTPMQRFSLWTRD